MNYNFPIYFWNNQTTRVKFEIFDAAPEDAVVTACMVFVSKDGKALLTRPDRGWGLPGGHVETGESPEECAAREVREEACVSIKNLKLAGGWKIEKMSPGESNNKYPDLSYMLLYTAEPEEIYDFAQTHESHERHFYDFDDIKDVYNNYERFAEILRYLRDLLAK